MWIFAPGGLLMPAIVPTDKADAHFTQDGKFDFQIRGRVDVHLQNFMDKYMEPGSFNPEIQYTPEMDYNVRFYTTHEAFAAAMAKAVMDINFEKFKPQAYDHDSKSHPYYDLLNSIWGSVTRLGRPGGKWAIGSSKSSYTGSTFAEGTYSGGSSGTWIDRYWDVRPDEESDDSPLFSDLHGDRWSDDSWTPSVADEIDDILRSVRDLPANQWEENLGEHEWGLVRSIAKARIRTERRGRKDRRRRASKQSA